MSPTAFFEYQSGSALTLYQRTGVISFLELLDGGSALKSKTPTLRLCGCRGKNRRLSDGIVVAHDLDNGTLIAMRPRGLIDGRVDPHTGEQGLDLVRKHGILGHEQLQPPFDSGLRNMGVRRRLQNGQGLLRARAFFGETGFYEVSTLCDGGLAELLGGFDGGDAEGGGDEVGQDEIHNGLLWNRVLGVILLDFGEKGLDVGVGGLVEEGGSFLAGEVVLDGEGDGQKRDMLMARTDLHLSGSVSLVLRPS